MLNPVVLVARLPVVSPAAVAPAVVRHVLDRTGVRCVMTRMPLR